MDNFDLTKFLAEGKLHEAMSPQDVVDIADTVAEEFTIESAEEGDFMVYSVGEMDVDGMFFELDTDVTSQTPERILKMSNLGVGEGWGGSFRINPKEEGYEVRNSEKGGLVAIIDNMGNFKMISADESRAEMGRAKGEETDYMQSRKETDDYMQEVLGQIKETLDDEAFDMAEKIIDSLGAEKAVGELVRAMSTDDAKLYLGGIIRDYDLKEEKIKEKPSTNNKMKKSELKEMIKAAMSEDARTDAEEEGYLDGMRDEKEDMKEAEDVEVEDNENVDVDIEKDLDVKVDDEESEVDIDVKASMPGESEDVEEVQALLMKAQEAAEALGDDKLQDQIGNTITYFTRAHVAGNVSEADLDMDLSVGDRAKEAEIGLEEVYADKEEMFQIHTTDSPDGKGKWSPWAGQFFPNARSADEWMKKMEDGGYKFGLKKVPVPPKEVKEAEAQLNESMFPMWDKIK
jgi:hypothetical protein